MSTLRIGIDMDGIIADFSRAFHEKEEQLFGPGPGISAGQPEKEEEAQESAAPAPEATNDAKEEPPAETPHQARRRRDAVWRAIQSTPNFWETLQPIDEGAVARIHALMVQHRWEVFFITQRPRTDGDTV